MKHRSTFLVIIICFITHLSFSQENNNNQNPNYKISKDKYMALSNSSTLLQGTTAQETYKAIDWLEEKRELRMLRKKHRANRALWRHQERMERAKNTDFHEYRYSDDNYYGNNNRGFYNRGLYNNWFTPNSLLNLGLMGYLIFD